MLASACRQPDRAPQIALFPPCPPFCAPLLSYASLLSRSRLFRLHFGRSERSAYSSPCLRGRHPVRHTRYTLFGTRQLHGGDLGGRRSCDHHPHKSYRGMHVTLRAMPFRRHQIQSSTFVDILDFVDKNPTISNICPKSLLKNNMRGGLVGPCGDLRV